MSRKVKESSSSNNTSLDESKALINGSWGMNLVRKYLASIEEKFDKTMKEICLKLDKIEKTQVRTVMKLKVWNFRSVTKTNKLAGRTRQ